MMPLLSGSPGTIGATPFRFGFNASSRRSNRIPAIRELLSGPWQRKQVSAIIGRISRLKRTCAFPAAVASMAASSILLTCIVVSIYTRDTNKK
jgi:hypothetical protein